MPATVLREADRKDGDEKADSRHCCTVSPISGAFRLLPGVFLLHRGANCYGLCLAYSLEFGDQVVDR